VLVDVQAHEFALPGDAEEPYSIECGEHCHGAGERGGADNEAADELGLKDFHTAAVEQAGESIGRLGNDRGYTEGARTARGVLAAGEQAQRQRAPNTTRAVHGPSAYRVIDAVIFEQFHR